MKEFIRKLIRESLLKEWVDTEELMDNFKKWFTMKSNIPVGEYIGGGVEGEIYSVDKSRVIKFGYSTLQTHAQHLANRTLDGIVKVYQTGIVEAPKRFKYPNESTPQDYEYSGIPLLDPNKMARPKDFKIGYMVMEKLYPSKELEETLNTLDSKVWREFSGAYLEDDNGNHENTINVLKKTHPRMDGGAMLKVMFREQNNNEFITDVRNFITKQYPNELINVFDRLMVIFKGIKSTGIEWGDIHSKQFAYNSNGDITALDISFDNPTSYNPETNTVSYDEPRHMKAVNMKTKNKIGEENQ